MAARRISLSPALLLATVLAACLGHRPPASSERPRDRAITCVTPVAPDPATDRGKRIAWLSHAVDSALTETMGPRAGAVADAGAAARTPAALATIASSELAEAALAAVVVHQDGATAETLLKALLTREVRDKSDARGSFSRIDGSTDLELERVTIALVPLLTKFHHCVTASLEADLELGLKETIGALRRDAARHKVGATRAWLEASVSLAALGDALGDVAATEQGSEQIDAWRRTTRLHGVPEYDAADETAAQLEALTLGSLYISSDAARGNCRAGAQFLWSDLAAHWFPAKNRLAGPSSVRSDMAIDGARVLAALAGWSDPPAGDADIALSHVNALLGAMDDGYLPDDETRALFGTDERVVTSTWADSDRLSVGRDAYLWTTRDLAMGSTSARAPRTTSTPSATDTESDHPIDIQLAAPDAVPFDITARAAGAVVPITTTVAQQRGAMLALISSPLWTPKPDVAPIAGGDLTTDLTLPLPADGELAVDGRRTGAQLAFGAVIGVRGGNAGYAVQISEAQGCHGAPKVELRTDPEAKLAHLRITHGDAAHACRPHVVLLIAGGHASTHAELAALMDSAHATVVQHTVELKPEPVKPVPAPTPSTPAAAVKDPVELTSWGANARIDRGVLKGLSLSVERREARKPDDSGDMPVAFVHRKSGGKPIFFGVLEVNGVDLAAVLDSTNKGSGAKH